AFPLHEEASAIKLRWLLDGIWYTASFSAQPQDTTLPGNGPSNELLNYLGNNPFYFDLETLIPRHSVFAIELTYVELLPYQLSRVDYFYPNDYSLIQSLPVLSQEFNLSIQSQRKIETLDMTSHPGATIMNNDYDATLTWELLNQPANQDIEIYYKLDPDQLGLFGFSTYYGNIQNPCDSAGNGFFGFIVEPDAGDSSNTIPKIFTLIIDRSGSMSGNKISQASDAASYIVDHLNVGDKFNIVDFSSQATSFQPDHVDYTPNNRLNALNYISNIGASGGTSISNAFSVAVPQFANEDSNAAKIVIFFTDGLDGPTQNIINHVNQLTAQYQPDLNIFTLGIGASVNRDLLTQLATQHYGLAEFLDNQDLALTISNFYLTIQNPVLTNISLAFSASTVSEVFPVQLPNLYKGRQLMVVGRYQQPDSGQVTLSGTNQINAQQYAYPLVLTDSFIEGNKFLVKLWAK
ncbi:MAG: VWA domain-containing protein, partial [Bacteroidetes bacterium]|nr:VWA domain-containing protein [Bacteroidota bacterium]